MKFLSDEPVNRGRQGELDYLKAVCILGMIILHIGEDCADGTGVLYVIASYLCMFLGAAAFMICMGIGIRYSRKQEPKDLIFRGVELLTVGQLLNLLRNTLPNLIAWWITGKPFFISNAFLVLQADILSFAGLAFLLIALLKKLKVPSPGILLIGVLMNLSVLPIARFVTFPDSFLIKQLMGYFVMNDAEAFFPLFSYFVFVAFGYCLGGIYPRIISKDALSLRILLICLPAAAVYYAFRMHVPFPGMPDFGSDEWYVLLYGPDALSTILCALVALALFHRVISLCGGKIPKFVEHVSRHINQYYFVSYLFTIPMQTILIAVRGERMPGWLPQTLYSLAVIFLCWAIISLNERTLHLGIADLQNPRRAWVYAAVWILTVVSVIYIYPRVDTFATIWNDYLLP